eukprot:6236188-Lingulodinium_polyedra.AAC.1
MAKPAVSSQPREFEESVYLDAELQVVEPFDLDPARPCFMDGSCVHPTECLLARAGWAAVQLDDEDRLLRVIRGDVPAGRQQSAA